MKEKEKFKPGDLCLYYDMPVIVLEIVYRHRGSNKKGYYSCLVLFPQCGIDTVKSSNLKKIEPAS